MSATHVINREFMDALKSGSLSPLLQAVKDDHSLMLGIRGGYVSVYYRGGELLKITEAEPGKYPVSTNADYRGTAQAEIAVRKHPVVSSVDGGIQVVRDIPLLKWDMDRHSKIRSSHEREFQQLVVRENNRSRSAGSTDYFITDMEHASGDARYDMLGARWLSGDRKRGNRLTPVIMEMKYGESALTGKAGLMEHLEKLRAHLGKADFVDTLKANVASQFDQLSELDLISFNRSKSIETFSCDDQLLVVLVFAAMNPRSSGLLESLKLARDDLTESPIPNTDVKVFQATFCGYQMHENSMLSIDAAIAQLEHWKGS